MRLALLAATVFVTSAAEPKLAAAGPALDDDQHKATVDAVNTELPPVTVAADEAEYGVGIRLRHVVLPKFMLQLFVQKAADGAGNNGIGVDFTRRKGSLELQLGFEYEHVNVGEGIWIERGKTVPGDDPDYVLSPDSAGHDLGWFTVEFTFLNHAEITKWMSFRYGGGLGLGIITGELDHYNIRCNGSATNDAPSPACVPMNRGGQGQFTDEDGNILAGATAFKYNLPPVFPVVNAIIGLQFKPMPKWTVNVEAGIRTLPFVGIDTSYFF